MSLLPKEKIRDFTQILEALAARLGAKLQTVSYAEHDLAAHFDCDGNKNFPDAVSQFTHIVIQLRIHLLSCA